MRRGPERCGPAMRRIAIALACAAAVLSAAAIIVPFAVSEDSIKGAAVRMVVAMTGRVPIIAGHASLTLVPSPSVTIEDVTIPGLPDSPPLLTAAAMEGRLSLFSLLTGNLDISSLSLERPHLTLIGRKDGARSWRFNEGVLAKAAAGQKDIGLPVGSVRFLDGIIAYSDARTQRSLTLNVHDGAVNWPSLGGALSASAECEWRGQSVDFSVSVNDAAALIAGGGSEMRGKATSDLLQISLSGNLTADGHLDGQLALTSASLRNALRWGGLRLAEGGNIGVVKLQSPISVDASGVTLSASQLELDGNEVEGAMRLQVDGPRPKLSATLAAETLDITPYAAEFRLADDAPRRWRSDPIDLDILSVVDLDLRVSSAETIIDKARLGRTAAALAMQDGRLELSLGEAAAYGGTLKGRLTMRAAAGQKARVETQMSIDNVDLGKALGDFFGFHRFEGIGSGTIDAGAAGDTVAQLSKTLKGRADFTVENGSLVGVDLADLMQRVARRPLSASLESHGGRTSFEKGSVHFAIFDGLATTSNMHLDNGGLQVSLEGTAGVPTRSLDLSGLASWQTQAAATPILLPFHVSGDWEEPVVAPDTETLIRRSGATAPLFKEGARAFSGTTGAAVQGDMPAVIRPIDSP